jgi:hypothetical protein
MRRLVLAFGFAAALVASAAAQEFDSPEALLETFYEPFFTGAFAEDESIFRSAFLQELYEQDEANTPIGEMGALGFDPYINGQDFDIADFEIVATEVEGDVATAEVYFTNFGEPTELIYDLVFEDNGWRIDDVTSISPGREYRLSEIFLETLGVEP